MPPQPEASGIPVQSKVRDLQVNGRRPVYTGDIHIVMGQGVQAIAPGAVDFTLSGDPRFEFRLSMPSGLAGANAEQGDLTIQPTIPHPAICSPTPFHVVSTSWTAPPGTLNIRGILAGHGPIQHAVKPDGTEEPVGRVLFHLINFKKYFCLRLHRMEGTQIHSWAGRLELPFGKWFVTIDAFQDIDTRLAEASSTAGYALTHVGMLRRTDNKLFDQGQASGALEALYWFLSLANGGRCGMTLFYGLRHLDHPLWEQWEVYVPSPVAKHGNWFISHNPHACAAAAETFYRTWSEEAKRQWLSEAIGAYVACSQQRGSLELTLANSQVVLELLAWVAMMEENNLMSEKGFQALAAADRLRTMLFWLNAPTAIPEDLKELMAVSEGSDAPETAVNIRNLIIHPTRTKRTQRRQIKPEAIYEAWKLNMWYAELALLRLIGYSGPYNNRIGNPAGKVWDMTPWRALDVDTAPP